MKYTLIILLSIFICGSFSSCKKENKENKDIIVAKPKPKAKSGLKTINVGDSIREQEVQWLGSQYTIVIKTIEDRLLPMAVDESGDQYYDQKSNLRIVRVDGTDVVNRNFQKSDFTGYCSGSDYAENGAFLGIVFRKIEGDKLVFGASVGSPDSSSDMFIPLIITVDRTGNLSISKDTSVDFEDEGV